MTLIEFAGCTFLAFGPPFVMFVTTIAHDPVRIIILLAAAFFWILSLVISSIWWFMVVPLRTEAAFGMAFSVLFQELFRYFTYIILRKTEHGLKKITEDSAELLENKHILAYVSGFGFGIVSGMFALVNVLADSIGPSTMGLKGGSDVFFITSSATALCFIMLHTFWGVIFFNGLDKKNYMQTLFVVLAHLGVSGVTLFNRLHMHAGSLMVIYAVLFISAAGAFKIAGGSAVSLKQAVAGR